MLRRRAMSGYLCLPIIQTLDGSLLRRTQSRFVKSIQLFPIFLYLFFRSLCVHPRNIPFLDSFAFPFTTFYPPCCFTCFCSLVQIRIHKSLAISPCLLYHSPALAVEDSIRFGLSRRYRHVLRSQRTSTQRRRKVMRNGLHKRHIPSRQLSPPKSLR